jgi:WXG100 family type VII secretion target
MYGGNIRITPEQLMGIGGQVGGSAASIDDQLRRLSAQVAPLGSDWAGAAQARFQELWSQWQRDAAGLQRALQEIATLMSAAGRRYAATEQEVASGFGRM